MPELDPTPEPNPDGGYWTRRDGGGYDVREPPWSLVPLVPLAGGRGSDERGLTSPSAP